jgi:hypothetical protein
MDFYGENYCGDCTQAVTAARKEAMEKDTDAGIAQRSALAERAHSTHRGRIRPNQPMTKADYWSAQNPETKNDGS